VSDLLGDWSDAPGHLLHLAIAFALAMPIGWNREREEHSAGIRTFPLVAIASCGLVQLAIMVLGPKGPTNAQVLQGLLTGVGFIGAGAIIRNGEITIGTATAASILNVSVIGAAVGYGYYDIAAILALANFIVLGGLRHFRRRE
jgi:putative Mg2+ transporter-C (MgtC) family protein